MINQSLYEGVVALALEEDLGTAGDLTSEATIDPAATAVAHFRTRRPGVIAGLGVAGYVFSVVDDSIRFDARVEDGARVDRDTVIAVVEGSARSILSAERTALNFLTRMSGVATQTALLVDAVEGTSARIADTRKTMPGLRALDKYSVRMGGGMNHRFGLHDAVMIKDNHIASVGSITKAVDAARARVGHTVTVEVEVENLRQLEEVLGTDTDIVLLDNMSPMDLAEAVRMVDGAMTTEASGGITLDNAREFAETGVDVISVGWITHSAPQLDIGLDFV
ncbi:MAG: carboxylating nicotinate-nucleotide diphosphorylase [Acidimicrobiia bacterium]|nr:carboxylating nicotinate-nucleotide diphosphorylase [Acidimicrobiia bacterium]